MSKVRVVALRSIALLLLLTGALISSPVDGASLQEQGRLVVLDVAWGSFASPSRIRPGAQDANLVIELMNNSTDTIVDPLACLNLEYPFYDVLNRSTLCSVVNGAFSERSVITYSFRLNVDNGAKPGLYNLSLVVNYKFNETYVTEELTVVVVVYPEIRLEILDAGWGLPDQQTTAAPGDSSVTLYVRVRNLNDDVVRGVRLKLLDNGLFSITPERVHLVDSVSSIQPGGTVTFTFTVGINEKVDPGVYEVPVELEFLDPNSAVVRQRDRIKLVVTGRERLVADYEPPVCKQGSRCELRVVVRNEGTGPAFNVEARVVNVISPSPQEVADELVGALIPGGVEQPQTSALLSISNPRVYLGRIRPGEAREASFVIYAGPASSVGFHVIQLALSYTSYDGSQNTISYDVPVNVAPWIPIVDVRASEFLLVRNRLNNVTLELVNIGEAPVYDLTLEVGIVRQESLTAPSATAALRESSKVFYVERLDPGGVKKLGLEIVELADTSSQISLEVRVAYRDSKGDYRLEERTIDLAVITRPAVRVSGLRVSPEVAWNGSSVVVQGSLINSGVGEARNLMVWLVADGPAVISDASSRFIGLLGEGVNTRFSLKFGISERANPTSLRVEVHVSYEDFLGRRYEIVEPLSIPVTIKYIGDAEEGQEGVVSAIEKLVNDMVSDQLLLTLTLVVAVLVITSVYVIVRSFRRREGVEEVLEGI